MLEGKIAIVTGGVRGIGFAIAEELADQGAEVVICSRNKAQVNEAVKNLNIHGKKAYGKVVDVSSFENCQQLIEFAYSINKRIDILVNNAGIFGPVGLVETNSPEDWKKVLDINILG